MELYKLLSVQQFQAGKYDVKEWHIRIKNGLIYVLTVSQGANKTKVKLNECLLEKKIQEGIYMSICIEGIEFTLIQNNKSFGLIHNQNDVEKHKEGYKNCLDQQEYELILAETESLLNHNDGINQLSMQYLKVTDASRKTTIVEYKVNLDNLAQIIQVQLSQLQQQQQQQQPQQYPSYQQQLPQETPTVFPSVDMNKSLQQKECIICMNKKKNHAPIPCGHMMYCEDCIKEIMKRKECSLCKARVDSVMKIYN